MENTFTIATFNCENLFSRSKVINRDDRTVGDKIMAKIDALNTELDKEVYDSEKIIRLYNEVSDFIKINNVRNKLLGGSKKKGYYLKVKGKKSWDGFIEFKKDNFNDDARTNTARVINLINAHIIGLIEIEDKRTLDSFNSRLLGKKPYKKYEYSMLIDAFDPRGIDVALLSRLPLVNIETHMYDEKEGSRIFSRDCLEVTVSPKKNYLIHVFVNHFKSQGYGIQEENDARRLAQTKRVTEIIRERKLDLEKDRVVVLGDFNAPPNHPSLAPLMNMTGLKDVLALKIPEPPKRWTYHYRKNEQIDFILVSKPLQSKCLRASVERQGMYNLHKYTVENENTWEEVQKKGIKASASDHGAVWAEFAY